MGFAIWLISQHNAIVVMFLKNKFEIDFSCGSTPYIRQNEIGKGLEWVSHQVSAHFGFSTHFGQFSVIAYEAPCQYGRDYCRYRDYRR